MKKILVVVAIILCAGVARVHADDIWGWLGGYRMMITTYTAQTDAAATHTYVAHPVKKVTYLNIGPAATIGSNIGSNFTVPANCSFTLEFTIQVSSFSHTVTPGTAGSVYWLAEGVQ